MYVQYVLYQYTDLYLFCKYRLHTITPSAFLQDFEIRRLTVCQLTEESNILSVVLGNFNSIRATPFYEI
jgi:hypothetical protein